MVWGLIVNVVRPTPSLFPWLVPSSDDMAAAPSDPLVRVMRFASLPSPRDTHLAGSIP